MPELTIRFIDEPGLISKLITFETGSLFCHTECLSRDGSTWVGAHAGTGVEARAKDWCRPTLERRYAVPVSELGYAKAMAWLEKKLGCPYDYADIAGMVLRSRAGASDHAVICSALMLGFMQQAGMQPLNCLEQFNYLITPETLHLSPVFIGRGVPNV